MTRNQKSLALSAALVLATGAVSAYQLLSPQRSWQNVPDYVVDNRGLDSISGGGVSATVAAITSNNAWNGAGAGTVVEAHSGSVGSFQLGDGTPMLNFEDPLGVCTGNCLAATFTGYYTRQGKNVRIVDADIVTNDSYNWTTVGSGSCSGEFYIEGVQVHEIGHGLGLGHTNVAGATMYPSVAACDNGPATIEADDIAGILALYGADDGGGGGGGGGCSLGQKGDACTSDGQCCSGKCRGGGCR